MTDPTNVPPVKPNFWASPTMWAAFVAVVSAMLSLAGHTIDAGTQAKLVNALASGADAVTIIAGIFAANFHKKTTTRLVNDKVGLINDNAALTSVIENTPNTPTAKGDGNGA